MGEPPDLLVLERGGGGHKIVHEGGAEDERLLVRVRVRVWVRVRVRRAMVRGRIRVKVRVKVRDRGSVRVSYGVRG